MIATASRGWCSPPSSQTRVNGVEEVRMRGEPVPYATLVRHVRRYRPSESRRRGFHPNLPAEPTDAEMTRG